MESTILQSQNEFLKHRQSKLESISKEELIKDFKIIEDELKRVLKENYNLRKKEISDEQLNLVIKDQLLDLKDKVFGKSSEKYIDPKKNKNSDKDNNDPKDPPTPPKPRIQKPSERYPNLIVVENKIEDNPLPSCKCCGSEMHDSGLTEDTEQLNIIPKKYEISRTKKVKYNCRKCHGDLKTAKSRTRIKEGSVLTDESIIDISMSKYCDLIPIERQVAMARREGLLNLPPQTLIEATHNLSSFLSEVYSKLRAEILTSKVVHADETPHRMLEGSEKKSWFLWGVSTKQTCYFECHETRSADVASSILINSNCEVLITDAYAGYGKAIRSINEKRKKLNKPKIINANCNAHARRYFFKAFKGHNIEAEYFLIHYQKIYELEAKTSGKSPDIILEIRSEMLLYFKEMKARSLEDIHKYSSKSKLAKAMSYFVTNYESLILFLNNPEVAIDNNSQERLLRSHVVGRKTWYGTHSKRGAATASVLFSVVETCKLININPREYIKKLVIDVNSGKIAYTPREYKELQK